MEYCVNVLLYSLFRFEKATQRIFDFPARWIARRRWVWEAYRRRGVDDIEAQIVHMLDDPETGIGSALSAAHLAVLCVLVAMGTQCFLMAAVPVKLSWSPWLLVPSAVGGFVLSGMFTHRKGKYLRYFKVFESKSVVWQRKIAIGSFLAIIGIWLYGIAGFAYFLRAIHS